MLTNWRSLAFTAINKTATAWLAVENINKK